MKAAGERSGALSGGLAGGAGSSGRIRAGIAERERVAAVLSESLAQGRITPAEFADRSARAASALTLGELAPLIADLAGSAARPRLSTAQREEAMAELRDHFAAGRIGQAELERRSAVVAAATTGDDLIGVFGDLRDYTDDDRQVRIGDVERRDAQDTLAAHFAEGRLSSEEFGSRTAALAAAVSRAELKSVFADLPPDEPTGAAEMLPHQRWPSGQGWWR